MALEQFEHFQEDPRICYELVDGEWYAYTGPAGDIHAPVPCEEVDGELYPFAEEGAPVVQGALHGKTVRDWENMVTGLLIDWPDVGIFSDVYLYWYKGQRNPYAPDLYVLPRVRPQERPRQSVLEWKEPSKAVFVLEVLSDANDDEDPDEKLLAYQDRGKINEYVICEPRTNPSRVWGFRLENGVYIPVEPDERGRIWSEELSGWFGVNEAGEGQVWNQAGIAMPRHEQALRQLEEQTRRADEQTRRADEQTRKTEAAEAEAREAQARVRELEEMLQQAREGGL